MATRATHRDDADHARSELAVLVETEARLDRALVDARLIAESARALARQRADEAAAAQEAELARERERIATEIEAATRARIAELARTARDAVARYDAVRGPRLAEIARRVAARLVAIANEEAT